MFARKWAISTLMVGAIAWVGVWGAHGPQPVSAVMATGTIAYVRDSNEIRLIESNGSNDRRLWIEPRIDVSDTVTGLAWRPDAAELAFASNHEEACSIYSSDIFAIKPDGSGLRRMTNPPACAELASYPQGSVKVDVQNNTLDSGFFFIYVQGAAGLQAIGLPPGGSGSVTLNNVADFGNMLQYVQWIEGFYRWSSLAVNVQPAQIVNAGTLVISSGAHNFGMFAPVWRSDGSKIGFILGDCAGMYQVPVYPQAGALGESVIDTNSVAPCVMDWGPTPALADQVLYFSGLTDRSIYRVSEGSTTPGAKLYSYDTPDLLLGLQWLPDGSGFLFSKSTDYDANANLYEYNFTSGAVLTRTQFTTEFVRGFSISPDGQTVVFERAPSLYSSNADLWLVNRDGTNMRPLVSNGTLPAWSLRTPPVVRRLFLPLIRR